MSSNILSDKDVNAPVAIAAPQGLEKGTEIKSMEYHRQVLQSKMSDEACVKVMAPITQ